MKPIVLCLALSISSIGFSQSTREFGNITPAEFNMRKYDKETTAKAIVLFDYGETVVGNAGIVFYSTTSNQGEVMVILPSTTNQIFFDSQNYAVIREFYQRIVGIERQPMILSKQPSR